MIFIVCTILSAIIVHEYYILYSYTYKIIQIVI